MSEAALKHRPQPMAPSRAAVAGRPALRQLLGRLIGALARVRDAGTDDSPPGEPPDWWEDEDFVYLEFSLDAPDAVSADICIHEGRVFVRVGR